MIEARIDLFTEVSTNRWSWKSPSLRSDRVTSMGDPPEPEAVVSVLKRGVSQSTRTERERVKLVTL